MYDYRAESLQNNLGHEFYECVHLRIIFQNTRHIKSFSSYKDRLSRSQKSNAVHKL